MWTLIYSSRSKTTQVSAEPEKLLLTEHLKILHIPARDCPYDIRSKVSELSEACFTSDMLKEALAHPSSQMPFFTLFQLFLGTYDFAFAKSCIISLDNLQIQYYVGR